MSSWCFSLVHGSLLLVSLLASGRAHALCGDGLWEDGEACDDGNNVANDACNECRLSCEAINGALVAHTCGHGAFGPFEQAAAQSYPGFVFTELSTPHTYYTLLLSGDPGQNRSAVAYWPTSDSLFAFFLKEPYPFSVYSSAGVEVPVLFEHEVSCAEMGSGSLTWVKVYELTAENPYDVVFGPIEGADVSVAVELMSPPSAHFWDRDGDGLGGNLAGLGSCQYEEPTVDVTGDCDDSDANVHPGATERCDGIDSDCSGGEDIIAEGLCDEEGAGAACVDAGEEIRCGCASDAHCGDEATCNVGVQRCEAPAGPGGAGSGEGGRGGEGGAAGEVGLSAGGVGGSAPGAGGRGDAGESGQLAGAAGEPAEAGNAGASSEAGNTGTVTGGSSGNGESGAAPTSGGARGSGASGGAGGEAAAPESGGPASDSGCGCRTANAGPPSAGLGLLAAVLMGLLRRRRSRR